MKLVELLAKVVGEWPKGAEYAVQDGDRRQTIKYGKTKGNLGIKAEGHSLDVWQNRSWGFTSNHDFDHDELASDFLTAIVTKAQWQAERDRQDGGGWKRHRGNKLPIDGGLYIEAKLRCGDIQRGYAQDFIWPHAACDVEVNLMKYRVISQPQAEETVPMSNPVKSFNPYEADDTDHGPVNVQWVEAKTDQIDGPIKWRDTIIHCQAIIEDCEREIAANENRLALEGFALIPAMTPVMGVGDLEMSDWRNWKEGDIIKVIANKCRHKFETGDEVTVINIDEEDIAYRIEATKDGEDWWLAKSDGKFIRRP